MEAKKAQVNTMKDYILGCQAFFEKVLTDLLLRAPEDPAAFLLQVLFYVVRGAGGLEKGREIWRE